MSAKHTVMVILEAIPGKEKELRKALAKVAAHSLLERGCIKYHIFEEASKFGLFEVWESKEIHLEQFSKPYIIDFIKQSEQLLSKPFDAVMGQEVLL